MDWLNEIKSLERLVLPRFHRNLPDADLQAIAALRDHPRLAFIQGDAFSSNPSEDWRTFHVTQSKAVFWRDWDRGQTFLPAIREAGLTFELTKLPTDSYRLRIQNQPLRDLLILEDKPISELYIGGTQVTDLSPIAELPLRVLEFSLADVTDLSPLRKMPLEQLTLGSGAVADLSPLAGMPLQKLYMHQCMAVGELSPILNLQTLQSLTIPVTARNIESLRSLKSLRWLGFRGDTRVAVGSTPVDLFWKRWPGMAWSRALNESGIDYTATQADDGLWSVKIKSKEFTDCGIFTGADLGELILQDTSVSDLRPLEGLALTKLHLHKTGVTDLAPLRGMPLRELNIHGTRIANLTELRGLQLQSLVLSETPVTSLSPLDGMPLTKLHMGGTRIADISALRGMPLVEVRMPWCPLITDLSPLANSLALASITLPPNAEEIEFLQDITTLRRISFTEKFKENTTSYQPDQTAEQFWKEYDKAGWRTALRKAGIIPKTQRQLPDRTWEVDLERSGITSLEILRDAEISILRLGNTAVSDLRPLSGMALKHLALYNTSVSDLGPLEGMPLETLSISGTAVGDISVLRGMPLRRVRLHGCNKPRQSLAPRRLHETHRLDAAAERAGLRVPPKLNPLSRAEGP